MRQQGAHAGDHSVGVAHRRPDLFCHSRLRGNLPGTKDFEAEPCEGGDGKGVQQSWKSEPYDPARAKQLLAETGYPSQFKEPTVTVYSYTYQDVWLPSFAQTIAGYWDMVGIKTKIVPIDYATVRSWYIAKPIDQRLVGAVYPLTMPANSGYLSAVQMTWGGGGLTDLLHDPEWDNLYKQVNAELDDGKRAPLITKLYEQGYQHYALMATVDLRRLWAVSNKIGEWREPVSDTLSRDYEIMQHK